MASAGGYTLKAGVDEAGKRMLQSARNEAALLRLLLGNGSPLTSRFLSFRINPPKPFPELELIRLAETSPALVRYGIGNGKWLGARAWGAQGAAQLVKEGLVAHQAGSEEKGSLFGPGARGHSSLCRAARGTNAGLKRRNLSR